MNVQENISLRQYSGMAVGGQAKYAVEVHSRMEVLEALSWAQEKQVPAIMIGAGTNIIWRDEGFAGLLLIDRIEHYEQYDEDETNTYLTIGSGENWDSVVQRSVTAGLTGIEALSLIPGTAGATPVQNVGAYGQEIAYVLSSLEAFDTLAKDYVNIPASECGFSYRSSRFNSIDRGRFYITAITLHLTKANPSPPFYSAVQAYFDKHKTNQYTPQALRAAVVSIRSAKLPDPKVNPNTGSFFSNPIISKQQFLSLMAEYHTVPHWQAGPDSMKISAAWLIEQAGYKDFHDEATGMATWANQPLVMVNEHAKNTADVLAFKQKIVRAVDTKFNITLKQEPELLPLM